MLNWILLTGKRVAQLLDKTLIVGWNGELERRALWIVFGRIRGNDLEVALIQFAEQCIEVLLDLGLPTGIEVTPIFLTRL